MGFTIQDLPAEERPRERLIELGAHDLSAHELLQIVLGQGTPGESVSIISQRLISHFGSLQKLAEASPTELLSIKGIGIAQATKLKAISELARRLSNFSEVSNPNSLTEPKQIYQLLKPKLIDHKKEHFYLVALNSQNIAVHETSVGIVNASLVHPREVFSEAIKECASSIVIAHNHPSGNLTPSEADLLITHRLIEAGKLLGINVLDHLIVTRTNYLSLKAEGMM